MTSWKSLTIGLLSGLIVTTFWMFESTGIIGAILTGVLGAAFGIFVEDNFLY